MLTSGSNWISKDSWDRMREGMFCMDANAVGDFKEEIEELCSVASCDYPTTQAIQQVFAGLHDINPNIHPRAD